MATSGPNIDGHVEVHAERESKTRVEHAGKLSKTAFLTPAPVSAGELLLRFTSQTFSVVSRVGARPRSAGDASTRLVASLAM